jgi:hypothetical protein
VTDLPLLLAVVLSAAALAVLALGAVLGTRRRERARRHAEQRSIRRRTTIQPADDPILRAMGLGVDEAGGRDRPGPSDASNGSDRGDA